MQITGSDRSEIHHSIGHRKQGFYSFNSCHITVMATYLQEMNNYRPALLDSQPSTLWHSIYSYPFSPCHSIDQNSCPWASSNFCTFILPNYGIWSERGMELRLWATSLFLLIKHHHDSLWQESDACWWHSLQRWNIITQHNAQHLEATKIQVQEASSYYPNNTFNIRVLVTNK
jgi:hypothetical protein